MLAGGLCLPKYDGFVDQYNFGPGTFLLNNN